MRRQFIVVVYDISSDKRRTKLHNALLNYGTPVQYSVFECLLEPEKVEEMKRAGGAGRGRRDRSLKRITFYVSRFTFYDCVSRFSSIKGGKALLTMLEK